MQERFIAPIPWSISTYPEGNWSRNKGDTPLLKWEKEAWDIPEAKGKHVVLRVYADYLEAFGDTRVVVRERR